VPAGPDWLYEIKHDGYRLRVRRDGDTVRLFTRRGYDWTGRYPAIAATARELRARSFTLDGEVCVCGPDGVAIFDALHRRGTVSESMLYVFDLLALDGEDLRAMPLGDRKKRLARLVGKRRIGIVSSVTHSIVTGARQPLDQFELVDTTRQPGPMLPSPGVDVIVGPFMNQIATSPALVVHRMSLLPSPL
jgi:ATP-dependent DNA ligase